MSIGKGWRRLTLYHTRIICRPSQIRNTERKSNKTQTSTTLNKKAEFKRAFKVADKRDSAGRMSLKMSPEELKNKLKVTRNTHRELRR